MKKSYVFAYNDTVGTREEVKEVLDKMSYVETWRYDMPNVFYIVSDYSADQMAKQFESITGNKGRFIFLEYNVNAQGRLTEESWFLLANKHHKKSSS